LGGIGRWRSAASDDGARRHRAGTFGEEAALDVVWVGMANPMRGAVLGDLPDERLTELARGGDQAAFAAIVRRYQTELLRHARRLVTDGRADDVVQQEFLHAWG